MIDILRMALALARWLFLRLAVAVVVGTAFAPAAAMLIERRHVFAQHVAWGTGSALAVLAAFNLYERWRYRRLYVKTYRRHAPNGDDHG
jgi:hypothetical protein